MGVGDTVVQGSQRWSVPSGLGAGSRSWGSGQGGLGTLYKSTGAGVGGAVQSVRPMPTADQLSGGSPVAQQTPDWQNPYSDPKPGGWQNPYLPESPVATPVSATPTFGGDILASGANMGGLLGYQLDQNYLNANYGIDSGMLELRKKLLGLEGQGIGTDKASIGNRRSGVERDSDFLRQQRGMYDQQLANNLAQIDTRHQLDRLDHENQYVSGGAHFTPGNVYRRDRIDAAAEQNRTDARLGTQMSQLGIDRSLSGNDTQLREFDFDMDRLNQRLSANGINLQMLGLNQQQLGLALQHQLENLGLGMLDANGILNMAGDGSQQGDFALNWLMEQLQGGTLVPGQGVPFPGIG